MSEDVKFNRGETEEGTVDIGSSDPLRGHDPDAKVDDATPENTAADQHSVSQSPKPTHLRVAVVCLGLLCVLLLAGIIILGLYYNRVNDDTSRVTVERLVTQHDNLAKDRDQLETKNKDLTRERDQLQTSNKDLTRERVQLETSNKNLTREKDQLETSYDNLTRERDQLETSYKNLTRVRDQLETSYNNLTTARDQLETTLNTVMKERDDLKKSLCETNDGWTKFGCSFYYVSTEDKTWKASRQDCQQRGADLVVINNKEEQEFLLTFNKRVWIGLTDRDKERKWIWVDGTPLTTAYWHQTQPDNADGKSEEGEDCVETNYYQAWNDNVCNSPQYWICEREI